MRERVSTVMIDVHTYMHVYLYIRIPIYFYVSRYTFLHSYLWSEPAGEVDDTGVLVLGVQAPCHAHHTELLVHDVLHCHREKKGGQRKVKQRKGGEKGVSG